MYDSMSSNRSEPVVDRRTFMRTTAATAVTLGAVGTLPTARAQTEIDFESWFDGVENYRGVVDMTGESTVTVAVGAEGNGGGFAFEPAAVRIDPGTTVVWEWTGDGGLHNVAAKDGAYESDLLSAVGETFDHTFDGEGVSYYACTPHEAIGMRAAIVVGNVLVGSSVSSFPEPDFGTWFDDVDNYAGTVDATGLTEVTISVGSAGNGGNFAFEPASVRIDPGTTVIWEWTGQGGAHNVAATDGSFESELLTEQGESFALEFDGDGISMYVCEPHAGLGMKGAVVVGAGGHYETTLTPLGMAVVGAVGLIFGIPFVYALYSHFKELGDQATIAAAKQAARAPENVVIDTETSP